MGSACKERVLAAIRRQRPDRVPRGELAIGDRLLRALADAAGFKGDDPLARRLAVHRHLRMDLVNLHEYPVEELGRDAEGRALFRGAFGEEFAVNAHGHALVRPALPAPEAAADYRPPNPARATARQLDFFRAHSDLFLLAQIGGPVSQLDWTLGTERMMVWCLDDLAAMTVYARRLVEFELGRAALFLDRGADGLLIADDIAFNSGALLPPAVMAALAWPLYREMIARIKARRDVPVFLHTDGDIRGLLDAIAACGFDGLHALQPSAGVDILDVKRRYGDRLCLMGNMDLDRLLPCGTPAEIAAQVRWLCRNIGAGGGYILSTCNILTDAIPLENAEAMYWEDG